MGARAAPDQQGRARILGVERLQHVRGSMARTAVLGRLEWQLGTVAELVQETPRVASLVVDVPEGQGHLARHHLDVGLTAEEGYQAARNCPIPRAPELARRAGTAHGADE